MSLTSFEIAEGAFLFNTNFGEAESIQINLDLRPASSDPCEVCSEQFIESISQNENTTIFEGELTQEDIVQIKIE